MNSARKNRAIFTNKFGVIAAAAGSAVGLGNIWRFPYELGVNGGFAFLLIYLLCIFILGLPIMLSELVIGRRAQNNATGAFKKLAPQSKWYLVGIIGVIAAFTILGFYFVVAGWSLEYVIQAIDNQFQNKSAEQLQQVFVTFSTDPIRPIIWASVFIVITSTVILAGVTKGIEKISKILMPFFFLLIILLCVRSITLPNAGEGLMFLFRPDFSKINSSVILSALGQSFFSLSIGMGCLITYGSYISKKNNLTHTAFEVTALDTIVSILAAIAIFPVVFSLGINPAQGPKLVFVTLPHVFTLIPWGYFWAILFFILITVAALTSTISLMEVITAYASEEFHIKRNIIIIIATAILIPISAICSLSIGIGSEYTIFGLTVFDLFDYISSKILLPLGGLFTAIFLGWFYKKDEIKDELQSHKRKINSTLFNIYMFLLRYIVPVAITLVFINETGIFRLLTAF